MATAMAIDLAGLLAPISVAAPTGVDIRADFSPQSLYFILKDSQARARSEERKRREAYVDKPDTDFHADDWMPVLTSCEEVLRGKSKDLEIAAWYVEALVRHHGFAGLRDGLRLMRELVERYWDGIFPRPDEDGVATTVAPIAALNGVDGPGTLIWPISNIPITSVQPWGVWHYRQAQSLEGAEQKVVDQRVAEGGVTLPMFESAINQSPPRFFADLLEDVQQAQKELQQLTEFLDDRCGLGENGYPNAPSTTSLGDALTDALQTVRKATAGMMLELEPDAATSSPTDDAPQAAPASASDSAPITHATLSREQAFKSILQLAEYFKKSEPQSPVAYLLEKAVRWGKMPLPRLLRELIKDEPTLVQLYQVMGVTDAHENQP